MKKQPIFKADENISWTITVVRSLQQFILPALTELGRLF